MATVLLLEDRDSDVSEIEAALREIGDFSVQRFEIASRAVDFLSDTLASGSGLPELIIVDLNLPNSSGYELLRFYHANPKIHMVPCVVWSIQDGEVDRQFTTWLGSKKLISKSSGPATLRKSLASLLKREPEPKTKPHSGEPSKTA